MTDSTTKGTKKAGNGASAMPDFDAFTSFNRQAFERFDEIAQTMFEGLDTYREEAARFVGHRMRQGFAMPRNLACCRSPQEAFGVYLEYLQTAQKEYLEEAGKLADLASKSAKTVSEEVSEAAAEATKVKD